jgi:hypothetical protein
VSRRQRIPGRAEAIDPREDTPRHHDESGGQITSKLGIERGAFAIAIHAVVTDLACWAAGLLVVTGAVLWYAAMARLPVHVVLPLAALIAPLASVGA